jgi:hypothetical protein
MSSKNPLLWDAANNRYTGTGSRALNDLGTTPATGGPAGLPDIDETSSMASNVSTGSTVTVQTNATDVTLDTNASAASAGTTNTDLDFDLSGGSSSSVVPTLPTAPTGSWEMTGIHKIWIQLQITNLVINVQILTQNLSQTKII